MYTMWNYLANQELKNSLQQTQISNQYAINKWQPPPMETFNMASDVMFCAYLWPCLLPFSNHLITDRWHLFTFIDRHDRSIDEKRKQFSRDCNLSQRRLSLRAITSTSQRVQETPIRQPQHSSRKSIEWTKDQIFDQNYHSTFDNPSPTQNNSTTTYHPVQSN